MHSQGEVIVQPLMLREDNPLSGESFCLAKTLPISMNSVVRHRHDICDCKITQLSRFLGFPHLLLQVWNSKLFQTMLNVHRQRSYAGCV